MHVLQRLRGGADLERFEIEWVDPRAIGFETKWVEIIASWALGSRSPRDFPRMPPTHAELSFLRSFFLRSLRFVSRLLLHETRHFFAVSRNVLFLRVITSYVAGADCSFDRLLSVQTAVMSGLTFTLPESAPLLTLRAVGESEAAWAPVKRWTGHLKGKDAIAPFQSVFAILCSYFPFLCHSSTFTSASPDLFHFPSFPLQ